MSSLMQFSGKTGRKGVELQFYQVEPGGFYTAHFTGNWNENGPIYEGKDYHPYPESSCHPVDDVTCIKCGKCHPRLHVAWRKPCGMFGVWVIFRYNGAKNVPDLSVPIALYKLPKDARPLTDSENSVYWHD